MWKVGIYFSSENVQVHGKCKSEYADRILMSV